jgi:hypothetical protein
MQPTGASQFRCAFALPFSAPEQLVCWRPSSTGPHRLAGWRCLAVVRAEVHRARLSLMLGLGAMFVYALLLKSMGVRGMLPESPPP